MLFFLDVKFGTQVAPANELGLVEGIGIGVGGLATILLFSLVCCYARSRGGGGGGGDEAGGRGRGHGRRLRRAFGGFGRARGGGGGGGGLGGRGMRGDEEDGGDFGRGEGGGSGGGQEMDGVEDRGWEWEEDERVKGWGCCGCWRRSGGGMEMGEMREEMETFEFSNPLAS